MDSSHQINVPLRSGGKKMRKRRELDALIAHSLAKRSTCRRSNFNGGSHSQDKLLSTSTDDPEDYPWYKVSHARRNRKYIFLRMCGPLVFLAGITMLVGFMYWLYFDLRQQIYEYRQKIEEVSATSQNIPDTLQKWHETSSSLLKNQTTILLKLNDLQHMVEMLRKNFTEYKTFVDIQQNYAKDQKLVADFGAKIEAVTTDIESIKEHYNTIFEKQSALEVNLIKLQSNFSDIKSKASGLTEIPATYLDEVHTLKTNFSSDMKLLGANINTVNNTLGQKSEMLRDELIVHKTKLDELYDRFENITSHVTSIENSWPEYKQKIVDFEKHAIHMENDMTKLKSKVQIIDSLYNMCTTCKHFYDDTIQNYYKHAEIPQTTPRPPALLMDSYTVKELVEANVRRGDTTPNP